MSRKEHHGKTGPEWVELAFLEKISERLPEEIEVLQALAELSTTTGQFEKGLVLDRRLSRLLPGGETIVGGSIDAVKAILGGLGRVLQVNTARAKGEDPEPARARTSKPSSPQAPINR